MRIQTIFTNHKPWIFSLVNAEDGKKEPGYFSGTFLFNVLKLCVTTFFF